MRKLETKIEREKGGLYIRLGTEHKEALLNGNILHFSNHSVPIFISLKFAVEVDERIDKILENL